MDQLPLALLCSISKFFQPKTILHFLRINKSFQVIRKSSLFQALVPNFPTNFLEQDSVDLFSLTDTYFLISPEYFVSYSLFSVNVLQRKKKNSSWYPVWSNSHLEITQVCFFSEDSLVLSVPSCLFFLSFDGRILNKVFIESTTTATTLRHSRMCTQGKHVYIFELFFAWKQLRVRKFNGHGEESAGILYGPKEDFIDSISQVQIQDNKIYIQIGHSCYVYSIDYKRLESNFLHTFTVRGWGFAICKNVMWSLHTKWVFVQDLSGNPIMNRKMKNLLFSNQLQSDGEQLCFLSSGGMTLFSLIPIWHH